MAESSKSSTISLNSAVSFKGSPLNSLRKCDEQIASLSSQIKSSRKEINLTESCIRNLLEDSSRLRSSREEQNEKILLTNKIIAESDTECLRIKNKLPFLSRRSVLNNIERLHSQLRMNNYKPKEELLVLKEITRLENSLPLLDQYKVKLNENKRLRSDKTKVVNLRNANYSKLQKMHEREKYLSERLKCLQESLDVKIQSLHDVEKDKVALVQIAKDKLQKRKEKEKGFHGTNVAKLKQNSPVKLSKENSSIFSSRFAPIKKNLYEPEISACKILLGYATSLSVKLSSQSSYPSPTLEKKFFITNSSIIKNKGSFYTKPQYELQINSLNKSKKRNKKKNSLKRGLNHPPEVVSNCLDLGIRIPKTNEDVSAFCESVEEKLSYFENLNDQNKFVHEMTERVSKDNEINNCDIPNENISRKEELIHCEGNKSASKVVLSEAADTCSDVESGVGDDESVLTQIEEEQHKPSTLSVTTDNMISLAPPKSGLCDYDPSVSVDSTSSGCSSSCHVNSSSLPSPVTFINSPSNITNIKSKLGQVECKTMCSNMQNLSIDYSSAMSFKRSVSLDSQNVPQSLECYRSNISQNVTGDNSVANITDKNASKKFSDKSKAVPQIVGPIEGGFCAVPPVTRNEAPSSMNYAAAASKKAT